MSTRVRYRCDIQDCPQETEKMRGWNRKIQVAFSTEQTEGRSVTPYAEDVEIDLCPKHYQAYLDSLNILAIGAQGHNVYFIKGEKSEQN